MGSAQTKGECKKFPYDEKVVEGMKYKVRILQHEVEEMVCLREKESRMYEQEMALFAVKEAEWARERKKLKEEVKKMRKVLEESKKRDAEILGENGGENYLVHHIREDQARRDEAVEKWKQLYFSIKVELDHLILRTNQGERAWRRTYEEDVEKELRAKEESIELLESRIALLEQQVLKREREVDILRQSLKIMFHNKLGRA
ncbi:unnamed protein product [Cuscuta epithymum]|uniref:Uncharacterized protein n=1 Tax=Cuscuta epithymum TaxID=186058 RepID=A0AAV0EEP9_9ASTE|nr:unnamed protein product [Cuscuta epithymum]